jgi:CRISPR/Cas system endoribonuclease Cas6 (RAMP superfamily)
MTLRGLLGRITFEGKVAPYIPILKLAEICHVGKATSFGFGRIKLTIQD